MKNFFYLLLSSLVFSCSSESETSEKDTSYTDISIWTDMGRDGSDDVLSDAEHDTISDADMAQPFSIPETEAGIQTRWFVGLLNSKSVIATQEIEEHFSAAFLTAVPAAAVIALVNQLRATSPWEPFQIFGDASETSLSILMRDKGGLTAVLSIRTESEKISGARIRFAPEHGEFPKSWEALDAAVDGAAERADVLVSEIIDGNCTDIHRHSNNTPFALGSLFKLYVLDALAEGVIAGTHQWDEQVEVRDEYKSFSSGDFQSLPDGSMVDARTLANAMISISDNTATDLLLRTLGRETVEAQMATTHSDPAINIPFFSTRELFQLKVPNNIPEIEAYLAMTSEEQKTFLDTVLSIRGLPNLALSPPWNLPRYVEELEWFATGDDLCKVMAKFQKQRKTEPNYQIVADVLAINPGMNYETQAAEFPYVGFKGGSEPGVLTGAWLLERADGRSFFISIALNDPKKPVNLENSVGVYYGAFQLVNLTP